MIEPCPSHDVLVGHHRWINPAYFDTVAAESDELAAHVRKGCLEMADPEPLSIFDHVYAEAHPLIDEEREQFAAYLDTFEGSAHA